MGSFKTPKGTELKILDLRGKDYLEVKYRLVWFREDHPDWTIETEPASITEKAALFKALIRDQSGRVVATSHKFENVQGFGDFIEKAETGAVGRALALCGYGTQFCADELDEGARIVDSPTEKSAQKPAQRPGGSIPPGSSAKGPDCCGKPMMVSRYNESEWYCLKCKKKQMRTAPGPLVSDPCVEDAPF